MVVIYPNLCYYEVFVLLVALSLKSTAMVMAAWSVHQTTPFPGQA